MDTLESACTTLSTIAKAVEVCAKKRNATTAWDLERAFCSSLQATLEDIIAFSPSDENFTHEQELNLLFHAVLQPLLTFYETVTLYMSDLQRGCEPHAAEGVLSEMEVKLKNLMIGRVKALKKQVHGYLQPVDTLLLLYIIDVLGSPPLEVISKKELAALQSLRRRAKVVGLKDLEQLAELFSTETLTVGRQQKCLTSMRRDVEHHWEFVQMTIHGIWRDAMVYSNDCVSAPEDNPVVFSGSGNHYTQNADFKSSRRNHIHGNFEASQTGQKIDTNEYKNIHQPTGRPTAETSIYQHPSPIRYQGQITNNSAQKSSILNSHDVPAEVPSLGTVNTEIRRKQFGLSNAQYDRSKNISGKQHERMFNPPQQTHSHGTKLSAHRQHQECPPNLPGVSNGSYQQSHSSSDPHRQNRSKRYDEGHAAPNSDAYLADMGAIELGDMSNRSRFRSRQPGLQPGWNTSGDLSQSQQQAQSLLLRPGEGMSGHSTQQKPSTDASRSRQQYARTPHMQYHPDHERRNYVQQSRIGASNEKHVQAQSGAGHVQAQSRGGHVQAQSRGGHVQARSRGGHVQARSRGGHVQDQSRADHVQAQSRAGRVQPQSRAGHVATGVGGAAILSVTTATMNATHADEDDTDECCTGECGCCSDACGCCSGSWGCCSGSWGCCSGSSGCCSSGSGIDGDGCWPNCCSDSGAKRGENDDDSCCIIM